MLDIYIYLYPKLLVFFSQNKRQSKGVQLISQSKGADAKEMTYFDDEWEEKYSKPVTVFCGSQTLASAMALNGIYMYYIVK